MLLTIFLSIVFCASMAMMLFSCVAFIQDNNSSTPYWRPGSAVCLQQHRFMLVIKVVLEGILLGFLLYLVCAIGIRNGAVGMAHLYDEKVQKRVIELGLASAEEIKKRSIAFKALCIPGYVVYVLLCVFVINGAQSFWESFWQMFVILEIMNLIDRFLIDGYWVGHTNA